MPKKSKNLCVDDLRHAEYYGMQPVFDELYRRSLDGDNFTDLMDIILSRDNILLAYRNIKANGGSYLLRDPEEEVLPCKRGYVRLTWNKDSRYCVDGILCQTPEELFDLLLTDYQDFELLRRTKGRREVTEADEKAVEKLCQPYLDWRKGALK